MSWSLRSNGPLHALTGTLLSSVAISASLGASHREPEMPEIRRVLWTFSRAPETHLPISHSISPRPVSQRTQRSIIRSVRRPPGRRCSCSRKGVDSCEVVMSSDRR
jgi:hypothetical protein